MPDIQVQHIAASWRCVLQLWTDNICIGYTRDPKSHILCTWVQCATFGGMAWADIFVFQSARKKTKLLQDIEYLLTAKFHQICSVVLEEKTKMFQLIRCQGDHLGIPISLKNTYLVEDIEILLLIKFLGVWVSVLVFYVMCNDNSVIYVTAQMCRGLQKLYLRSGSERHRHFVGFL